MDFQPDYRHVETAARNHRPQRLPLYEHYINDESIEKIAGFQFPDLDTENASDWTRYFELYCDFFLRMTYDTVSYEYCVTEMLPGGGALLGECAGPIQTRSDCEAYPWDDLPNLYWQQAEKRFRTMRECMPAGMKLVGGIGNGVFEISEDLVGFENLCYMQVDDPELFADLYVRIGDLLVTLWSRMVREFGDIIAICRIGDDMGFKTGTLVAPQTLIVNVVPQYSRIIDVIHKAGRPFLLHSCGRIFDVMEHLIDAGIDAKHSNEDAIAPLDKWIESYGDRIGLFGGIDTDRLCRMTPDDIFHFVLEEGMRLRQMARGFALGSGNSIPPYVPAEGYLAMIEAAKELRRREG